MRQKLITKNETWLRYAVYLGIGTIVVLSLQGSTTTHRWLIVPLCLAFVWALYSVLLNKYNLSQRNEEFAQTIERHPEYQLLDGGGSAPWFISKLGAIDELHGARDQKVTNVVSTPEWTYGDLTYNLYGQIKNSEYVKAHVYYGIMTTQLPRELPNVFFDSKKARRRQFRLHFAKEQRHSLEGDFDEYFATYFPDGYTIDSMSFISPEVMWALRSARDYDIEIYRNRLFLYGPLFDPEKQLQDMSVKLLEIKKQLADNVTTYRDARLPFSEGRKRVAAQAVTLKGSTFWKRLGTVLVVGYIIIRCIALFWQ